MTIEIIKQAKQVKYKDIIFDVECIDNELQFTFKEILNSATGFIKGLEGVKSTKIDEYWSKKCLVLKFDFEHGGLNECQFMYFYEFFEVLN